MKKFLGLLLLLAVPARAGELPYYFSHHLPLRLDVVGSASPRGGSGSSSSSTGSFIDSIFKICDDGDGTKCVQIQASGITTGNTVIPITVGGTTAAPQLSVPAGPTNGPGLFIGSIAGAVGFNQLTNSTVGVGINTGAINRFYTNNAFTGLWQSAIFGWTNSNDASGTVDTLMTREGAAIIQFGSDVNGTAVDYILKAPDAITGSNVSGGDLNLNMGRGTGTATGTATILGRTLMQASGATAHTNAHAAAICESKTLSNTSATATALANVALASNSAGGARITATVTCTNGTEYAASTVTSYQSFANKAGTISFGTATTQTESNGASTGATINCTVAPSWVANGNSVDFKVTPVITGAATITTAYINVENLGPGQVQCQ